MRKKDNLVSYHMLLLLTAFLYLVINYSVHVCAGHCELQ